MIRTHSRRSAATDSDCSLDGTIALDPSVLSTKKVVRARKAQSRPTCHPAMKLDPVVYPAYDQLLFALFYK